MSNPIPNPPQNFVHSSRRGFLGAAALAATGGAATLSAPAARANPLSAGAADDFQFEIQRTEAEWRSILTEAEYGIMREAKREVPRSSPWWDNERAGTYHCKGCDLPLYSSRWQVNPDIGFVFFRQNIPNSVLMGVDQTNPYGNSDEPVPDILALIELHCRRCGSHLGHLLVINNAALHCTNGAALNFVPDAV